MVVALSDRQDTTASAQQAQFLSLAQPAPSSVPTDSSEKLCPSFTLTSKTSLFYAEGKERKGPFKLQELAELLKAGRVTPETLVWCKAMGDR